MKEVDIFTSEATHPMRKVPTDHPRGVIIRNEEAIFVADAHLLMVIAKIVGNIIASKA